MFLSRSLSERNEHEKFEKSLGMPLSHLSNATPSKVQRAKPPSFFYNFSPLSELNNGMNTYGRAWPARVASTKKGICRGVISRVDWLRAQP